MASSSRLQTWVSVDDDSDFPLENLPYGVFSSPEFSRAHLGSALGNFVIDLHFLASNSVFGVDDSLLLAANLNPLMAAGKASWRRVRTRLQELFALPQSADSLALSETLKQSLKPASEVAMLMPAEIGDYTDFYSSRPHATNIGIMFRGVDNALQPNWLHIPIGYHGRSSSVIVSGTPVRRPLGQTVPVEGQAPIFGPCKTLDFELEMAFFVGPGNKLGEPIPIAEANDHIFGVVLMNDWSARDIQKWEYVPLGPFNGKNFATTISPWVVTMDALEPFARLSPPQEPEVLPYLRDSTPALYDIQLEVALQPEGSSEAYVLSRTNFLNMYWSMKQQLVHHASGGCSMRPGDLLGSGTISGPTPDSYGSMLELCWKGTKPIPLPNGTERRFLLDGDTVIMRGVCVAENGLRIGFGSCTGKVLPSL